MKKIIYIATILSLSACTTSPSASVIAPEDSDQKVLERTEPVVPCDEVEDMRKRGVCQFNLIIDEAINTNNDTLCETIVDDYLRSNCKQSVKDAN